MSAQILYLPHPDGQHRKPTVNLAVIPNNILIPWFDSLDPRDPMCKRIFKEFSRYRDLRRDQKDLFGDACVTYDWSTLAQARMSATMDANQYGVPFYIYQTGTDRYMTTPRRMVTDFVDTYGTHYGPDEITRLCIVRPQAEVRL